MGTLADRPPLVAAPADPADDAALAGALARGFLDDPVMRWLVPDDESRLRRIARFYRVELAALRARGEVWTVGPGWGGALWAAPGRWRATTGEVLRSVPTLIPTFGATAARGLRLLGEMDRRHPTEPHWYLAILATDPFHQGKGVGRSLLEPVLSRCDDEGLGAYLESSKESNVAFYGRFGFEVTDVLEVPGAPALHLMWRDPREGRGSR